MLVVTVKYRKRAIKEAKLQFAELILIVDQSI